MKKKTVTQRQPEDAKHWSIELAVLVLASAIFETLREPFSHVTHLAMRML